MILWNRVEYSYNATFHRDWKEQTDLVSYISLRGRHSNGKRKGILGARETRGTREEGRREEPARRPLFSPIPPKLCMQK